MEKESDHKIPVLQIEKGLPFNPGTRLTLKNEICIIGRSDGETEPDLSFSDSVISRTHLKIINNSESIFAVDTDSTNGTKINNTELTKGKQYPLNNGDRISLAHDSVILIFNPEKGKITDKIKFNEQDLYLDELRREIVIGNERLEISGKPFLLFRTLYNNKG